MSAPGDRFEREADSVAEAVVNGRTVASIGRIGDPPVMRRFDDEAVNSPRASRAAQDGEADIVPDESGMPKRAPGASTPVPGLRAVVDHRGGERMSERVRRFMEHRIGHDFGRVRVHTDDKASRAAARLDALAFTSGDHIYFGRGRYEPSTTAGQRLLAHELAHVVQQTGTIRRACSSGGGCTWQKQPRVVRDDCKTSGPADRNNYITRLAVDMSAQTVVATWSGGATNTFDCSPNPDVTPVGSDVVGVKCGANHTNLKKDGMAWFTGFESEGLRIGFHDSQRVGRGIHSHGCVRVCCGDAQTINRNTWSGRTRIRVTR